MSTMQPWDFASPLEPGVTLLEASAGTGKTYNITTLVLRLVAEQGLKMAELLVVTFTRAATAELRDRVRARLAEALAVMQGTRTAPKNDAVLVYLLRRGASDPSWAALCLRRLRAAQADFDQCLISTIHGFCQRMLQQHAFEAQADFDLELVQDTAGLEQELVADWITTELYADDPERYAFLVNECGVDRESLSGLAQLALRDPDLEVLPGDEQWAQPEDWEAELGAFVRSWEGAWAAEVEALFAQTRAEGGLPEGGNNKYRSKRVAKELAGLGRALRAARDWRRPPKVGYFASAAIAEKLAEGHPLPTHEALDALEHLVSFPQRVAAGERARFVRWVRAEFASRNRRRRQQAFSDLMGRLAQVLDRAPSDPGRHALVQAIGKRFRAALIDEFQDTDGRQWTIFRALFQRPGAWLFLIGDPKQAIYGFRGANVHVYLQARAEAGGRCFTMDVNHRTDARLLAAFNHLMDRQGFFGGRGIEYVRVNAPERPPTQTDRLRPAAGWHEPDAAPLQLRFVDRSLAGSSQDSPLPKGQLNALLPARVAEDVVELLESGTLLYRGEGSDGEERWERVLPGDVAVLTRTGEQARQVQAALGAAGVPAVLRGADSVLASDEAFELQLWLECLASPGHTGRARTVATTRLFGRSAALLAAVDAGDEEALRQWEAWLARLAAWRKAFADRGFLETLRRALREDVLATAGDEDEGADATIRLLRRPDGERRLTNLWHVAELLHTAEASARLGLPGLLAWLRRQRAQPDVDSETAELRLERDDAAVHVLTVHKSKGLQFPVVFAPNLWWARLPDPKDAAHVAPAAADPAQRILDLRAPQEKGATVERAEREEREEGLRLLYVALTRARHRCVVYTGHINGLGNSALAAALHGEGDGDDSDRLQRGAQRAATAGHEALKDDLRRLCDPAQGAAGPDGAPIVSLTMCTRPAGRVWAGVATPDEELRPRDFTRYWLDPRWSRHSYSALTHGKTVVYVGREGEAYPRDADAGTDEAPDMAAYEVDPEAARDAALAVGPGTGASGGDPTTTPQDDGALGGASASWAPVYSLPADVPDVPLASFPSGAGAGTCLHELLEHADFRWADPDPQTAGGCQSPGGTEGGAAGAESEGATALAALLDDRLPQHGFAADRWRDELLVGLLAALRTPLGGPLGATRLCDIPRCDRLDELRFDLPLAGGDRFGSAEDVMNPVRSEQLVGALRLRGAGGAGVPPDEETMRAAYLDGLGGFRPLCGFLTGSIDLVFRVPGADGPRWFVADYKSNRLDPHRQRRTPVQHFCLEGMRYEMEQHHYYLQYHLYTLALHRYLRHRLGAERYDYERHVGGVYYLFLRGMIGPDTPAVAGRRHGCFYDRPQLAVIDALDRLFTDPASWTGGPR